MIMITSIICMITGFATKSLTQPTCYPHGSEMTTVEVNNTAIIECLCNQTGRFVPHWKINRGQPLRQDELPPRHKITNQNLKISPVKQSDNGSTYQCVFFSHGVLILGPEIRLVVHAGGVRIIEGPEDTSVIEGSAAEFPCFFVGTSNIPLWKINNTVYSIDELPSEHFYRNQTLLVTNVNLSLNLTKYQCQIANIKSSVAVLIVFPGPGTTEDITTYLLTPSNPIHFGNSTFENSTLVYNNFDPVVNCNASICSRKTISIVIGVLVVAAFGIISFPIICFLLVYKCYHSTAVSTGGSDVGLEENPCYATEQKNIELTENICYSNVGKQFDNVSNSEVLYETVY